SLAEHLDRDADELFTVTRQCLDRYHELFDVPYPFGKYDQVFVPEFGAGAMENAGCVTIRDELVFRSAVTEAERQWRAGGGAHEYGNATLADLLDALSRVSEQDLTAWAGAWLRTSRVNTVYPQTEVDGDGRYRRVALVQTADPVLRPHRIAVGCYDGSARTRRVELTVDSGQTVVEALAGQPAAALLLVNDDDLTYTKARWSGAVESLPA